MLNNADIKKNYTQFKDEKIIRIAKKDAKGLRTDTVPILIEEIKKRKLNLSLIEWINAVRRNLSPAEKEAIIKKIQQSTCEICHKNNLLQGYTFKSVHSFFFDAVISHTEQIICKNCGIKKRRKAIISSLLFGWWSIEGLIITPFILIQNIMSIFNKKQQSKTIIEAFINSNIGTITIENEREAIIQELLRKHNADLD